MKERIHLNKDDRSFSQLSHITLHIVVNPSTMLDAQ